MTKRDEHWWHVVQSVLLEVTLFFAAIALLLFLVIGGVWLWETAKGESMIGAEERFTLEEFEERCRVLGIVQIEFTGTRPLGARHRATVTADVGTKTPYGTEYCFVHSSGSTLVEAVAGLANVIKEAQRECLGEEEDYTGV